MYQTYYVKNGRKYEPRGIWTLVGDVLPDGIWLIQSKRGSGRSMTSLVARISEVPKPVDLRTLGSYQLLTEMIADHLMDITDSKVPPAMRSTYKAVPKIYNISVQELAESIVSNLYKRFENED